MTGSNTPSAEEAARVDRGQRVRGEVEIDRAHDGKMRTRAAQRRPAGTLPADVTNASPAPIEAEDVVAVTDSGSAWEAREDEAERSRPPPARGVGRPR